MIKGKVIQGRSGRRVARPLRDFATGFVLFCLLAGPGILGPESVGAVLSMSAQAQIHLAEQMDEATMGVVATVAAGSPHGLITLFSLALAFASLFTLNLWIARHVRQVHATYRRRR